MQGEQTEQQCETLAGAGQLSAEVWEAGKLAVSGKALDLLGLGADVGQQHRHCAGQCSV